MAALAALSALAALAAAVAIAVASIVRPVDGRSTTVTAAVTSAAPVDSPFDRQAYWPTKPSVYKRQAAAAT
jgi:hypothetical protein